MNEPKAEPWLAGCPSRAAWYHRQHPHGSTSWPTSSTRPPARIVCTAVLKPQGSESAQKPSGTLVLDGTAERSRESPARCPHRSPPHRFWHRHHLLYGDSKINKQTTLSRGQTQEVPEREGRGHSRPILRHTSTSSSHCHCHCHTPADGPAELLCWRSPSPTAVPSKPRIRLKYEVMGTA